jgi:hypothetical protein
LAHRKGDERSSVWNEAKVGEVVSRGEYLNMVDIIDRLPEPRVVRVELDNKIGICRDRNPRIILVEVVEDYMVFIAIPDGKSDCDFMVWRYSPKLKPQLKVPTHDDLGKVFLELKKKHELIDEFLINATIRLLRDRRSVNEIIQHYFKDLDDTLKSEIRKFLITLKWIGLQEDVNYPPPRYMGSRMSLAVYALLEVGFSLSDLRRVIRYGKR